MKLLQNIVNLVLRGCLIVVQAEVSKCSYYAFMSLHEAFSIEVGIAYAVGIKGNHNGSTFELHVRWVHENSTKLG